MTTKTNARKRCILDFVQDYYAAHGYGPSNREIGAHCDISSSSMVRRYVLQLVESNLLDYQLGIARSLRPAALERQPVKAHPLPGGTPLHTRQIYQAILDYVQAHGVPPTLRELVSLTWADSSSTARFHVQRLAALGVLEVRPRVERGIVLR